MQHSYRTRNSINQQFRDAAPVYGGGYLCVNCNHPELEHAEDGHCTDWKCRCEKYVSPVLKTEE